MRANVVFCKTQEIIHFHNYGANAFAKASIHLDLAFKVL